jgi:metal-responsive CopG/Arc/MetJ family transcriptional regulator
MPTEKPKLLIIATEDLLRRIDDYRFENRINSKAEAVRRLLEKALQDYEKSPPLPKE